MSTSTAASTGSRSGRYIRWGGMAAILGALLIFMGLGISQISSSGQALAEFADTTPFFVTAALAWVGSVLVTFGLISLYAVQAEEAGGLGLVGFVAAVIGMVTFSGDLWGFTTAVPSLAVEAPGFLELVSEGTVAGPMAVAPLLAYITVALGMILFGIATYRAGVFSRIAASALIVGALLTVVPLPFTDVVLTGALAWMGYQAFTGNVTRSTTAGAEAAEREMETTRQR